MDDAISYLSGHYSTQDYSSYESDSSMQSTYSTPSKHSVGDVEFDHFIKCVYGVSDDDFQYINSRTWILDSAALDEYRNVLLNIENKTKLYNPFKRIMDRLFAELVNEGHEIDIHLAMLGNQPIRNMYTVRRPDGLCLFGQHQDPSHYTWALTKVFIEVYMKPWKPNPTSSVSSSTAISSAPLACTSKSANPSNSLFVTSGSQCGERSNASRHAKDNMAPPKAPSKSTDATSSGTIVDSNQLLPEHQLLNFYAPIAMALGKKRTRSPEAEDPNKRHRTDNERTSKEIQGTGYASECMAATCRPWVTGILIRGTSIRVAYFDRFGVIYASEFNFGQEPSKLALLALAIGKCTPIQAGFEPFLLPASSIAPSPQSLPSLLEPRVSLTGAETIIPQDTGEFNVKYPRYVMSGDPLHGYRELKSHGSIVLPCDPVYEVDGAEGSAMKDIGEEWDGDGEVGQYGNSTEKGRKGRYIVKLGWPIVNRPRIEARSLEEHYKAIPWTKEHLPIDHCSLTLTGSAMRLPRNLLSDLQTAHKLEERYFTTIVAAQYEYLWEVQSVEHFQDIFIDIVECHYFAARCGGILHRDLSENNLLWTSTHERPVGILDDWDLSSEIDGDGQVDSPAAHCRTGTSPFMAIDLLAADPPAHLYRHDLESLFYILVWAMVHYDIGSKPSRTPHTNKVLELWKGAFQISLLSKSHFICTEPGQMQIFQHVRPVFQHLVDAWLLPLWTMFNEANTYRSKNAKRPDYEPRTMGGLLTFENFMAALKQEPRRVPPELQCSMQRHSSL